METRRDVRRKNTLMTWPLVERISRPPKAVVTGRSRRPRRTARMQAWPQIETAGMRPRADLGRMVSRTRRKSARQPSDSSARSRPRHSRGPAPRAPTGKVERWDPWGLIALVYRPAGAVGWAPTSALLISVEKDLGQTPTNRSAATSRNAGSLSAHPMSTVGSVAATCENASVWAPKKTRAAARSPKTAETTVPVSATTVSACE